MKKLFILLLIFSSCGGAKTETEIKVELPETYELANIILALTEYGRTDEWEVQKHTQYYQDVLDYFEPVKNHPLLESVNYSREKWADYLSFRTDAYAFEFDKNNQLKRKFNFYANNGYKPFDENIELVNDFVQKSNFRNFFAEKKEFYDRIVNNYKDYYFIEQTVEFLNNKIGKPEQFNKRNFSYRIVLSPLVNRMNCHRNISANIVADFPSATIELMGNTIDNNDLTSRLNGCHMVFTEMDHGYINPISDKYKKLIAENFSNEIWDINSGYEGIDVFNEYMTWAAFDIFVREYFPEQADMVSMRWQYQNTTRGFFAQHAFTEKLKELYDKNEGNKFEAIYEPLLKWCKEVENTIALPTLLNVDFDNFIPVDINNIQLNFSEKMNCEKPFTIAVLEFVNGEKTGNRQFVEVKNFETINNDKSVVFALDTPYNEFGIFLTYYVNMQPITSQSNVFLAPDSFILLKKK